MNESRRTPKRWVLALAVCWAGSSLPAAAKSPAQSTEPPIPASSAQTTPQGLMVVPTRVVFEGRTRTAAITVINVGSKPGTYRLRLIRMRMGETGEIREIDASIAGEAFADTLVRFSPRQVELDPQGMQTVRLQLRKPADLPVGEYRSHLLIQAIPPVDSAAATKSSTPASGVAIQLTPVFGTAIPIIVRNGPTAATVNLSGLQLRKSRTPSEPSIARLMMSRVGNQSVYGDLIVTYVPTKGAPRVLGEMKGIAVYCPNSHRLVEVPLRWIPELDSGTAMVQVTLAQPEAKGIALAEATFALP